MVLHPSMLITDDDRDFRETLQDVFRPKGFRTLLAADGEEAVQIAAKSEIHLVLMDMHMPRLTGVEAIGRIKQFKAEVPCILMSGQLDPQTLSFAQVFDVLSKPISFEQVTATVSTAMRITYGWTA